jgi:hypothetical protein
MFCTSCKKEKDDKDFFIDSKKCYKCIYNEKVSKMKKITLPTYCKMCNELCGDKRWVYCSDECGQMGKKEHGKHYWIRHVRSMR